MKNKRKVTVTICCQMKIFLIRFIFLCFEIRSFRKSCQNDDDDGIAF